MHNYKLPKYFLFVDRYEEKILGKDITNLGIIYRNYHKKQNKNDIYKLRSYCTKKQIKFYISNNLKLAIKLKCDGIYIPAFNKNFILNKTSMNKQFLVIGSAHNHVEIKKKIDQGCEAIFLSPLFKVEKKNQYLGICKFKLLMLGYKKKFIALGGIRKANVKSLNMLNVHGIAGISYIKKNRPKYLGRFL
tara:strand:- start:1533 stop:2102 length:570 start_codon:yes stop_codon:yes gene_type:complete